MIIYIATSTTSKKYYIGQTQKTLSTRRKAHKRSAGLKRYKNIHFYNAIRKYGFNDFTWNVLESNIKTTDQLNKREIFWIKEMDTFNNGYNCSSGGLGSTCRKLSEETKRKISKSHQRCNLSEETLRKMSKASTGRFVSEETRKKISLAGKGRVVSEETRKKKRIATKGRVVSEETRQKLSKASTGHIMSEETKQKIRESCKRYHSKNSTNSTERAK